MSYPSALAKEKTALVRRGYASGAVARWRGRQQTNHGQHRLWLAHRLGWTHGYLAGLQRAVEIGLGQAIQEYDQVLAKVLEVEGVTE